jgi:glutamyl-tRNA reductase
MKKSPDEKMEEWADRVSQHELALARKQIAKGQDIDQVLESLSFRIKQKILHPIITEIKSSSAQPFDPDQNRQVYDKAKNWKSYDHIDDDLK